MRFIEIQADKNGAHAYQTISVDIPAPDGYALVPDDMAIPDTIPYVDIDVRDGVVTKMTAGAVPNIPETPAEPPAAEDTMSMLVDHEYRITMMELGVSADAESEDANVIQNS